MTRVMLSREGSCCVGAGPAAQREPRLGAPPHPPLQPAPPAVPPAAPAAPAAAATAVAAAAALREHALRAAAALRHHPLRAIVAGVGAAQFPRGHGLADIALHVIDTHSEPSTLASYGIPTSMTW